MLLRNREPDHTELRIEKYWDPYQAGEFYRLLEYRFDKKDHLIKGNEYGWLGSGDKNWANKTMKHYNIRITPPFLDESEY